MASFFASVRKLVSFKANSNLAITDASMRTMHEVPVVYGTKRGAGCGSSVLSMPLRSLIAPQRLVSRPPPPHQPLLK